MPRSPRTALPVLLLPLLAVVATLLALVLAVIAPPRADAMLVGAVATGELANGDRSPRHQADALARMRGMGMRVARVNVSWNEVARRCARQELAALRSHDNRCYDWRVIDSLVGEAGAARVQLLFSVDKAPRWLHGTDDPYFIGSSNRQWARTVHHYKAFITAIVTRYRRGSAHGTVRLWTIWNEPNSDHFWKPMRTVAQKRIAPHRYANLYGQAAIALKAADPTALVAPGPTGPKSTIKPLHYVQAFQRALPRRLPGSGRAERKFINAWAHNPYPDRTLAPRRGQFRAPRIGLNNLEVLTHQLDRSRLTRGLRIWATEFGYETNPPDATFGVSPYLQGRYLADALELLDSHRRVSIAIWYGLTDPPQLTDWQSGTYWNTGKPKPSAQWMRRPLSVSSQNVRRGAIVRVYARSNVRPRKTRIAHSFNGRTYRLLPMQRRRAADGTLRGTVRPFRRMWLRVWDGSGYGPPIMLRVR